MEQNILKYIERFKNDPDIFSILLLEQPDRFSPISDGFDALIIMITKDGHTFSRHYLIDEKKVQQRFISESELNNWFYHQRTKQIVEWLLTAKVLYDQEGWFSQYYAELLEFPEMMRERKICIEFSRFLRRYMAGKDLLRHGHTLDSYYEIIHALHHWARILLIEKGLHPEVVLWEQIRDVDSEIFKLYCELVEGDEPLAKRLQLLLLASQFSVNKLMRQSSRLIQHILASRAEPWTIGELAAHPLIKETDLELSLLLNKLVEKEIIFVNTDEVEHGVTTCKYYV